MYQNQDPEEQFELLELIGEGAYATVYKGKHINGQIVAIKIVPSTGEIQSLIKEIQILKECQHAHIVQYYGSFYKDGNLWLVMEYCAGGSIIDLIKITQRSLTESEIAAILYHVLLGIEYLHANKKIHRDIKAGNILLDEKGTIKIADFGVAAQLIYTNADKGTVIGTPVYMSPEVISKNRYNHLTDIWSLGVTAIELAEGKPPYSHIHPVRAMFAIKNNPPQGLTNPEQWSKEFNDFVKSCLKVQVSERPTAQQLLQSAFIKMGKQDQNKLVSLVENCLSQMESYRKQKIQATHEKLVTIISNQGNSEEDEQSCGTVVECGTLVIKENEPEVKKPENKELDFVAYAKQERIINEIIEVQLSDEQQIENMSQEDRKKFLQFLQQQMDDEIAKAKQKYLPKIEMLIQKIKQDDPQEPPPPPPPPQQPKKQQIVQQQIVQQPQPNKIEVSLPFNVNPEVLQKLSNMKIPQIKIQNHIDYLCSKIKGEDVQPPKEKIQVTIENQLYFKEKFPKIYAKHKFKQKSAHFEKLTSDETFLYAYMQLYQLDNRHQIFNNALQYFIDKISNPNFLQFVLEQTQKPYQFNQDWTEVTVPRLIEHIMNNDHSVDMIEIINFILKYSEFNFELILKNITTRLQLQEKTGLQKIHNMHPLIYLLTQILNIFEPRLDDVTEVVDEVLTALRHFIRDLLREYAVQTKVTPVGDFIVAFSTQLPSKIDSFYCATQLITIFVNEIANTISYLQFQKKLFSQQKIKLLDLVINLQNSTSLYKINFYFNFYDIQETKNGICQLCQFKDQKLISLHETEGNTLLLETCLECFSNETQISENFEEKIYLPSIIYGHACQKKDNWIKLLFENHYITQLSKKEKTQKQSKQIKPIKISEAQQFLSQLTADYTHLGDNIHKYLWYFAYMSFLFQTLFSTYRNIELILLAFFEDNSVQVRAKVLNQFQEYCLRIKNLDTPKKYVFPIFNTQFVIQRIRQRPQDVSKQIRGLAIKTILILLGNKVIELNSDYLEIIIKRLQDIELQVRIKTVQCCLDYVDIFRNLPQHDKIKFFEEVSKRLEERGEIADLASQLIMLLLVTDNKNRDVEIADRLLELTLDQNNLIIDYERIQNLINKLSDDNKIIDKTSLLHHILLRLFQFSTSLYKGDKSKLTSVENALRLIQIIVNENNTAQQRVAQKQIDNIMEITSYFLSMEDDHKNLYANILNGLFKLLIFCIEEFQTSKTYENHMPFQVSTKLKNQFDYLIIFIEKIIFGIHPKTAYVRSIFTLSVLLDLKYNPDGHKNIYSKLETVIKLILIKSNEDSMSFQFALIGFCQIFEYFEYFIQKSGVDVRSFLVEDLQVLYDCLLEYSKDTANEEIIFTMSKMWEKIPQLMFESCDFLKENLKQNSFPEPIIIAIYQTFYKSIIDANLQADKQQFDQKVDKSRISFLIKDIFNVVFQKHILHENKKIRILVLKLIELLFDNQLSIALQFGDYLILTLINEAEIAEPIIKKCLEVNAPNMLMQFKSGIKMIIQNKSLKPYFTNLNILVKNLNKQTLICKSPFYDVCSSKLCEYLKDLDNAFFLNKIDSKNYFEEVQFLLYQFIHLQYLSKNEIKAIIKGILYRVDDFLGRIERRLQELYVDKDYSLAKAVSFKVFCAYQLAVEPDKIFGENILTLRQFHQMKDKIKRKKEKETVKEQQCYEIQHKHINKFLQYINSSEINLAKQNINFDLSDSDYEKKKTINSGKVQQYKLELDLMEKILDFELGKVDEMLKLFDEIGVFDKVEETVGRNEEQEDDINEEQKEPDATKKLKKKTTKRKPRK